MTPVLYSFRRCPYAMRARMAVYASGIEVELREVVLKNKPQAMLDASAKGTVPVLLTPEAVIDESIDIMRWAIEQSGSDNLWLDWLAHDLIAYNDGEFKHYLDRYKYHDRYPEHPSDFYFDKAVTFIEKLEQTILVDSDRVCFLANPKMSALDLAIFPFVRQFAFVDKPKFDQLDTPKVQRWLANCISSELFLDVMHKYPAWTPEQDEKLIFIRPTSC